MINPEHLSKYVIVPTLIEINAYSEDAVNLLLLTAAQESHMGLWLHQKGGGPALGIYQMEPATHDDIWKNYLVYHEGVRTDAINRMVMGYDSKELPTCMIGNLNYATAMARCLYLRKPGKIPSDVEGWAHYWKQHYNTPLGKGTVEEAVFNYDRFVNR